ncbi:MAG: alpha/beta hydrolase [Gemmatimonadota bacterium]|nr:MAG: alpha/beta hydrolase [Gemmatimonadota bacterium]
MGKRRILRAKGPRRGIKTTRIVLPRELHAGRQRMFYFEAGVGAPVVMIHGLGGSSRWWFPLFPELTSANFRVLAPDLPGFGRSPGPMLPVAEAAKAVIGLADRIGLAQFFLCGHSRGGAIAAQIAADYRGRVRRLVLIDSAGIPGVGLGRLVGRLLQPWSWCPLGFYTTLLGDVIKAGPQTMLGGLRELRDYDMRPVLERVRVPSLVIWGKNDTLTPPEHGRRIVDRLANARLELVPKARHLPMLTHPETVSRLAVAFFIEDIKEETQRPS